MAAQSRSTLFSLSGPLILRLLLGMSCALDCAGYSVLTHEAIIDAAWKDGIVPLLLSRFPYATKEELLQAHAYVYGGAIIQDLRTGVGAFFRCPAFKLSMQSSHQRLDSSPSNLYYESDDLGFSHLLPVLYLLLYACVHWRREAADLRIF